MKNTPKYNLSIVLKILLRFLLSFSLFLFFSCSRLHDEKGKAYYAAARTDFKHILLIDGFVEPVKTIVHLCPREVDGTVQYLVEDGTYVEKDEVICIIEDQNLQNRCDQIQTALENAQAGLNKTKADLAMQYALLEAQVRTNIAETQIANLDSLQLKYSTPNQRRTKELQLQKAAVEKLRYDKKLASLSVIQQSEIRKLELEIQRLENRLAAAKELVNGLTIKSKQKGLATRPSYRVSGNKLQIGDPVWNNMPLVVMPDMSKMKIKIMAPEMDYKYINIGDSVSYTFDAMPQNTGSGKIVKKSPVGQQIKEGSKIKYFEIEASLDTCGILPEPGFTANCSVILKEVKDTIVIPQIAVFEQDSMRVVYVQKKNGFEMRQIIAGISSPKELVVAAGLEKDEVISLSKPKPAAVKSRKLLPEKQAE